MNKVSIQKMTNKILTIILFILIATYGLFIFTESFSVLKTFPTIQDFKTPIGGIMIWHYPYLTSINNSQRQIGNAFVLLVGVSYILLGIGLLKKELCANIALLFLISFDFICLPLRTVISCIIRKGEWDYLFGIMQSPYIIAGIFLSILLGYNLKLKLQKK